MSAQRAVRRNYKLGEPAESRSWQGRFASLAVELAASAAFLYLIWYAGTNGGAQ